MKKSIAIIGGGISGISIAQMLSDKCDVRVFEKKPKIGGLIHCSRQEGILYHKVGGHVFNSKNEEVSNWFWNFFDKNNEFIETKRIAKVLFNNQLVGYPIEDHLFQLPEAIATNAVHDLLKPKKADAENNFEAFLKNSFGNTLYAVYFQPYNKKIWNVDLSYVPLEWLEGKLPMPKVPDILINNIMRKEENKMVHSFFYYPKHGGSQFIIERLAKNINIKTDKLIEKIIVTADGKLLLNDQGPFDQVIYTGDIRVLPGYLNKDLLLPNEKKLKELKSNGTTNILCRCDKNNLSWLYIPEEKYRAHRIIYTGNFAESNNDSSGRSSCTVEFSNFLGIEEAKEELNNLPGNLEFISYNHEPNSYVIQNTETRGLIKAAKESLKRNNIFLLGRFAEWEYYNMDKCIESAMVLKEELLVN